MHACMYMPKWWFVKTVPCLLYMYVVTAFGINDDIALTMITQPFTCSVQSVVSAYNQCGGMQCHQSNLCP